MSAVEKIADWIKDKPIWWKHAVRLSLQNGELSQVDLDEIYNIARMEHGFLNEEDIYQLAKKPINTNGYGVESAEITLASISNVVNVGRLANDQHLSFLRKGLTIIYGDNGTGKSSYSRILKHACLARGSTPQILGNVFEKNTEKSSAVLSIHVDGNIETKHWNLDYTSDSNLKAIRVYDSAAADHFVTGEDELGYKPLGLKLLEDLSLAIDHVKGEVKKEVAPGYGMVVLPDFSDTKTSQFVKTLSHETDFFLLNEYIVTEEEIINLDKLSKDIAELKVTTPTQLRTELNRKKQLLLPLKIFIINSALSLSDSIFEDLQFRRLDLDQKSQFAEQLRKKLLSGMPISGIGGNEWKVMWNAAEKFFLSTGDDKKFPPTQSESCPLCLQEVSDESSIKLAGFSEFMADQVSLQVKEAKEAYDLLRNKVSECILDISQHQVAISMADEAEHGFSNVFNGFINELNNRKLIFSSEDLPGKINPLTDKVITKIEIILQQIDASLLEISDDGSVAEVINKKEQLHREIIDKKLFKSNLHHIKTNINRFKVVKMYQELDAQCKSRSVTEINSDICRTQVIAPLVNSFDDELEKFGFSRFQVKLKTRGRSGAQLLKLEILDSGEPLTAKQFSINLLYRSMKYN